MLSKIKNFCNPVADASRRYGAGSYEKDLILAIVVILTALIGFGLGRLSKIREQKTPITIENIRASAETGFRVAPAAETQFQTTKGEIVASKNGTKYHYPWCSGAQNIKEENKIWFASEQEAREAGYTPASNCKGLK